MAQKIKIGILGCGAVARRWYLPGLGKRNDKYELVAVADVNQVRAETAARDFCVPNWFKSLDEMIVAVRPDLIVVLTGHRDHYKSIKKSLLAGINVYSEKPFADTYKRGRHLCDIAKQRKLIFGAAPQVMFSTRNQKIKQIIASGVLGKVTLARVSCSNMGPASRKDIDYDPEWFYCDGGSMVSLGIYNLAALLYIMGIPKRVAGLSGIAIQNRQVVYGPAQGKKFKVKAPDNEVAMLDFGAGSFVLCDGSYSVLHPPKYEFEIHGAKGSLFAGGFGGKESVLLKRIGTKARFVGPEDDCHLNWTLAWGVEDMVAAILDKRSPIASAEFALQTIKIIESIRVSSRLGRYIRVRTC